MKTLSLDINLEGIKLNPSDEAKSKPEIARDIIKSMISFWQQTKVNNRGQVSEDDRRKIYKIFDCLDKVVKDSLTTLELEDDWMGFLRTVKREGGWPYHEVWFRMEQLIDEVKDR